ncbi:MAG: thioredoxin family protein [Thiohalobacteraceae bacterium]
MHVQLLIAPWCTSCHRAQEIWQRVCERHGMTLEILDLETLAGEETAGRLHLKIMPAVLFDGQPRAIGVQSEDEAEALLSREIGAGR